MGCLNSQSKSWQCKWAQEMLGYSGSYVLTLPACVFRLKYRFWRLWSKLSILELHTTWNFCLNHIHHELKLYILNTLKWGISQNHLLCICLLQRAPLLCPRKAHKIFIEPCRRGLTIWSSTQQIFKWTW